MSRTTAAARKALLQGFVAPKVASPTGFIFENAAGGPYKYGYPLKCTRANLLAVEEGLL